MMHKTMNIQRSIISIKPSAGFFIPKKSMLQSAFKTSWATNKTAGTLMLWVSDFFHTRKNAIPIMKYSEIHTGPKR